MRTTLLFLCACLCFGFSSYGQNEFKVRRGFKIDRRAPIYNIHVDDKGLKWVSDEQGLVLLQSANFAEPIEENEAEWALLSVPDGNYELNLQKEQLEKLLRTPLSNISTAQYDVTKQELWIGTKNQGLFQLKTAGGLSLIKVHTDKTSKLRSNTIQTIELVAPGKLWVGTNDGLLSINGSDSKLHGKNFSIEAIATINAEVWVVSDGEVLEFDRKKGDFFYLEVESDMTEGLVKDIAFDSQERIWIASEIITRYDFDSEKYEVYGPIQEFTSQNVNCIAVDFDDAVWVGTQDKGLYFIGKSSTLLAEVVLAVPLDCSPDASNAALQVRASGGEPPYNYQWAGGLSGANPENLPAGTYKVTVTDKDKTATEAEITIEDTQFAVEIAQVQAASIGGSADGQAQIRITPDSRAIKIQWDNGENTRLAQKLTTGEHRVTITGEKGCSTTKTVQIDEVLAPLKAAIELTAEVKCNGSATGSIQAKASGGQAPYTYSWNPSADGAESRTELPAGTYGLTVKDAEGNSATATIAIAQPEAITAVVTPTAPASTDNADGKAKVKAKGGVGNYTYQWDSGESTETAVQLKAGTHSVTITDGNGCTSTASVDISENIQKLSLSLEETQGVNCTGESTASLEATVSGGKAPFQYQWSTDKGTELKASELPAGAYSLTITDAAGNSATASKTVEQPEALSASASARAAASTNNADGKAKVTAKGGSGKYTYKWDTGETEALAEKLAAGTHEVTITDANGCSTTASVSITENILELTVNLEETAKVRCTEGSTAALKAVVSGGKPPFLYTWSTDKGKEDTATGLSKGSYQLTVTDAAGSSKVAEMAISEPAPLGLKLQQTAPATTNNSDGKASATASGGTGTYSYKWDNGGTSATVENLAPGDHSLTVTDQNGCTLSESINITENILPLVLSLKQTQEINCFGEKTAAIEVEAQGGKPPFQYQWNEATLSGKSLKNLGAGAYSLTLTDASDTQKEASISIESPEVLTATMEKPGRATNADSKDGKAKVTIAGGTSPYSYAWSNGETAAEALKLPMGTHTVTVTDTKGCSTTASATVEKKNLPALTAGQLSAGQTLQVSQIYFDADSTRMKETSFPVVKEIADFLEENPLVVIEVGGHTNSTPPHEFCDKLSTGRAKSVAEYIVEQGIDPTRVIYKGYGKRKPRFSNRTSDGRRRNQRVEIKILRLN